jgi:hypothetical protein
VKNGKGREEGRNGDSNKRKRAQWSKKEIKQEEYTQPLTVQLNFVSAEETGNTPSPLKQSELYKMRRRKRRKV